VDSGLERETSIEDIYVLFCHQTVFLAFTANNRQAYPIPKRELSGKLPFWYSASMHWGVSAFDFPDAPVQFLVNRNLNAIFFAEFDDGSGKQADFAVPFCLHILCH